MSPPEQERTPGEAGHGRARANDILKASGGFGGLVATIVLGSGATGIDDLTTRFGLAAVCLIAGLACVFAYLSGRD